MDFSTVLRQQSRNKIQSDFLRMKNEHNKVSTDPKTSKHVSAPDFFNQDSENKDPGTSESTKKPPARPGVSRLPVLAKSLRLQTTSDFSQSHRSWEEKPLAGKAKTKKPCTRPVPFGLSQPRSSTTRTNQQPLSAMQSQSGACSVRSENNVRSGHLTTHGVNSKPSQYPNVSKSDVDSTHNTRGKATDNANLLRQYAPSNTLKSVANPLSAIPNTNTQYQVSAAPCGQSAVTADACLETMNLLSLKDPTKVKQEGQDAQLSTQVNMSKASAVKGEKFQLDHAALLSILRNEGVSTTGLGSATPQSKPYNYVPQRVSVMKSRQKAAPATGLSRVVPFSPDAGALQSILQNEGVTVGGIAGATPRKSVCPGRATSVYTAQRVPVRKNVTEATGRCAVALRESPQKKWTTQRVRDTRRQPMSAMKWHMSQQSPYVGTPGLRSCKVDARPQQEVAEKDNEVVQRLFDDQEEELDTNVTEKDPDTQAGQPTNHTKPHSGEKMIRANTSEEEGEEEEEEQEQKMVGGRPLLQAPRESVIFFSTGKTLLRAPRLEKKSSSDQDRHGRSSTEQTQSHVAERTAIINPALQSLHRDLVLPKTCGLSPAVALLRKRLPPLEELRLDEEVATYTSACLPAALGFVPPRPRCGNPLASTLHFEESTRFVPICFEASSSLLSQPSSPQQER